MEFSKDQITKIKAIYQKQVEMNDDITKKDQWGFVWTMGTDFFTHLCRINNLFIYLLKTYNLDLEKEEIFLEWKESILKVQKKTKKEKRYYLNIYKRVDQKLTYLTSALYIGKEGEWIFKIEDYFNDRRNFKKLIAKSTLRQFIEVMASLGYLEIQKDFAPSNYFNLIFKSKIIDDYIIDKIDLASNFVNNYKNYFNLKYIKGYSIRDIFFSLHALFLYELCNSNFPVCLDIVVILRKQKNQKIPLPELFKTHKSGKSSIGKHFGTQTTIKNLIKNDLNLAMTIFNKLNDFLFEKYLNDWKVEILTIQSKVLEFFIKNDNGRPGQVQYRQLLLNDIKRYIEINEQEFINKNDLIKGMKNSYAIEASHIVDFIKCNKDEKYDPENGLLLGPTIHKLFDKNILVFDQEGNIWIKKDEYGEIVKQIKSEKLEHSLISTILTPETKNYINKRLELNGIDLEYFQKF